MSMLSRFHCVCVSVCVRVCVCAALNADQLWAVVMSHTVMSHEVGRTKRRDRQRNQTKSTGSPLMLVRSHTSRCTSTSFKFKKKSLL